MTTTTSSPDRFGSFLRGLLKKNRANMIYLLVLGFISLPLQYLVQMFRGWRDIDGTFYYNEMSGFGSTGIYVGGSIIMMTIIWLVTTLVIGIASTGYMQNRRAVDLYHSLPLTRHHLMLANFTAAFVTVALPLTINYLLTYLLAAIRMGMAPEATTFALGLSLLDLLGWYVTVFAMLAVILLMATQVGSTFDTFLFSGVFLAAMPILYALHYVLCDAFLYGFVENLDGRLLSCLSPATLMTGKNLCAVDGWDNVFGGGLAVWLALGVLLLLFAMYEYKKRPSERAESTARVGVAAFIFRLLAVLVGGTALGIAFYALVFGNFERNTIDLPVLLLCVAVFGVLVFLLVEAILGRGFKGIGRKSLLTGGILVAVTLIYIAILATGGLGFESRIPAADTVRSVTINYRGRYDYASRYDAEAIKNYSGYNNDGSRYTYYGYGTQDDVTLESAEAIEAVTKLHSAALAQRNDAGPAWEEESSGTSGRAVGKNILVTYQLKNGTSLTRQYYVTVDQEILSDFCALEDITEFRSLTSPLEGWSEETNEVELISVTGPAGLKTAGISERERITALMAALRADTASESTADYYSPARRTACYLYIESNWTWKWSEAPAPEDFWSSYTIPVSEDYTQTLALLEDWGITAQVAEDDWNMSRVFCWGCSENNSGLIVFPTWDGMEKNANDSYASVLLTREETELLLEKATSTHPNNGGDDSLYLCLGKSEGANGETINMPLYILISDAHAAGIPKVDELIEEYYGWYGDSAAENTVEYLPTGEIVVS